MLRWLVVADDLTGANDTGICFARGDAKAVSALSPGPMPPAEVWVFSTNSRYLAAPQAAEAVRSIFQATLSANRGLQPAKVRIYKKMDSTLRGNPGPELNALMDISGLRKALVAPALPAQQRSTVGGRAFWRGVPLEQTEFGSQIATDHLVELFRPHSAGSPFFLLDLDLVRCSVDEIAGRIRQDGEAGIWIADALTTEDLANLARAAQSAGIQLLCGSAGLAEAAARLSMQSDNPLQERPDPAADGSHHGFILAVAGSRSATAAGQVEFARREGMAILQPPVEFLEQGSLLQLEAWLRESLPVDPTEAILSMSGLPEIDHPGGLLADRLALAAGRLIEQLRPGGLVLIGGDTAAAVCAVLHTRLVLLGGEVEPGVVWGNLLDGDLSGLPVVTRAGGFGDAGSLYRSIRFLQSKT